MKRPNHDQDIRLYGKVFDIYCIVVDYIVGHHNLNLEDRKDEKDIFKYCKGWKRYLSLFDDVPLDPYEQIVIREGNFVCSFRLVDVTDVKKKIEKNLITPRHHLYYIDVIQESKEAA